MTYSSYRKPRPLNREIEHVRDTSLIIIATEGERTEPLYFSMECFNHKRIQIRVLPSQDGRSSPRDVLDRLHKEAEEYQFDEEVGDQFWLVIDRDRWTDEMLYEVIELCRDRHYRMALSKPCFELWLLLHFREAGELQWEQKSPSCGDVRAVLAPILDNLDRGSYDATYADRIRRAIEEAGKIDTDPEAPIPPGPATRVYWLVEELIAP